MHGVKGWDGWGQGLVESRAEKAKGVVGSRGRGGEGQGVGVLG